MFWVTTCLALGPYPQGARRDQLLRGGVTHVLNVADGRGPFEVEGFREVAWHAVRDLERIPTETAQTCLETLHRLLHEEPLGRVYVHCAAGQNRSPTILWLYLIAAGLSPHEAGDWIGRASLDAMPGHAALIDDDLVEWARRYGETHVLPGLRADLLEEPETRYVGE